MINLTKSQCENLADFIQDNIFRTIRDDFEIDNMDWLIDMVDAYKILREAERDITDKRKNIPNNNSNE